MDDPAMKAALAVSKAFAFLFTTKIGLIALASAAALIALVRIGSAAMSRVLLERAAGKKGGFAAGARGAVSEIASGIAWSASNLPTLVTSLAILALVVGLSGVVTRFDEYLNLQRRIREYGIVLKNLEGRTKVARVERLPGSSGTGRYAVEYFGEGGEGKPLASEEFELPGKEIYFDALVLNFEFSGIETGVVKNIAVPYRIFSDIVPQREGKRLAILDQAGTPYFFERGEDGVRGVSKDVFDARVAEISRMLASDEEAREAGIVRSVYGNAVHRALKPGEAFVVWTEQTGGLSVKEEEAF